MPKKQHIIGIVILLLVAGAIYMNRDRFMRDPIQVTHRLHRFGGTFNDASGVAPLMFEMERKVSLTSIKVVIASEILTNKYAHPLWHLVANPRSTPTKGFLYGMEMPGMRPAIPGAKAEQLTSGPTYRLLLEAGSQKAVYDFDLRFSPP